MGSTISLCMIVRNESGFLAEALTSAADLVDEMIVVDTGSTDDTVDIAAAHGARVAHVTIDHLADARNVALAMARGDWILQLDADERLSPDSAARVGELVCEDRDADAYLLGLFNYFGAGKWAAVSLTRLFRRLPDLQYRLRIHETVLPALVERGVRPVESGAAIHHLELAGPDRSEQKRRRNLAGLVEEITKVGDPTHNLRVFLELERHSLGVDRPQSLAALHAVLAERPDQEFAHRFAGGFALAAGDLDCAEFHFRRLAEVSPFAQERGLIGQASVACLRGDHARALPLVDAALAQVPLAHNYLNKALVLRNLGKENEARGWFSEALRRNPYLLDERIYLPGPRFSCYPSQCSLLPSFDEIADPLAFWRDVSHWE